MESFGGCRNVVHRLVLLYIVTVLRSDHWNDNGTPANTPAFDHPKVQRPTSPYAIKAVVLRPLRGRDHADDNARHGHRLDRPAPCQYPSWKRLLERL